MPSMTFEADPRSGSPRSSAERIGALTPANKDRSSSFQARRIVEICQLPQAGPGARLRLPRVNLTGDRLTRSENRIERRLPPLELPAAARVRRSRSQLDRAKPGDADARDRVEGRQLAGARELRSVGVHFDGHPDLRRILLPDDWVGHPLRKDYEEQAEYHGIPTTRDEPARRLRAPRRVAEEGGRRGGAPRKRCCSERAARSPDHGHGEQGSSPPHRDRRGDDSSTWVRSTRPPTA